MKTFSKPTLILVLGMIIIILGIPYGIYGLTLKGGESLGGTLILVGVFITILIVVIDRALVEKVNPKKLSFIELILMLLFYVFYSYNERKIIIDKENQKIDYFVLIENNGSFKNSDLKFKFPFNKILITNNNKAYINSISENFQKIELLSPKDWNSMTMQPQEIDNIKVQIYFNSDLNFTEKQIDSIILKEVKN